MNNDKIQKYFTTFRQCRYLKEALELLNNHKNYFTEYEYKILKTKLNFYYEDPEESISKSPIEINNEIDDSLFKFKKENFFFFDEEDIPDPKWICSRLGIRPGNTLLIHAFSNVGKSYFAAHLAACVANNLPLLDGKIPIERSGKVIHFDWELGEEDVRLYYWRIFNGLGLGKNTPQNIELIYPKSTLEHKNAKEMLINLCSDKILAIFDCLGAATPTSDLNDDRIRQYIDLLNDVGNKVNCAMILLHHEAKSSIGKTGAIDKSKGNSSIISACGGSIRLYKESEDSDDIILKVGKVRLGKNKFFTKYNLVDCGHENDKLKVSVGIKLVSNDKNEDSNEIILLNFLQNTELPNQSTMLNFMRNRTKIGKDKINSLIKKLISEDKIIIIKGQKNSSNYKLTEKSIEILTVLKNWNN